ncbi:S-phase kinase-associated protein 1 [Strigomonas culicis]|nr:S-phase kinase-associated protein 1 [Strigomonas culicis]|eukprot:EPY36925.1 S-phase kinase-associated protein 1 [Strigomonas culicis]
MSGLLKDMLDDQEGGDAIIPIPNVSGRTLCLVLEYMEYHSNNPAEPIEKPLKTTIDSLLCEWDKDFLFHKLLKDHDETQHEVLIDVIMAANFLNVKDLLDLTCACVANMIRGKSAEEIRALFNIENDFSPEEEDKIRDENRWCEES